MINSYRRDLLDKEIKLHEDNLFGMMLDIGGGTKRGRFNDSKYVTDHIILDKVKSTRTTIIGDAEHLPFKEGVFHSIKCTEVLEYLNSPEQAVSEMHRVLKGVGRAMISTPFNMGIHYDFDLVRFTKHKLERMFEANGFKIVYLSEQGRYFTVLGYMLKQAILNTKSRARWLLYWIFPILDLMVRIDEWGFVKNSQFLSSFTTGYFVSAIKHSNEMETKNQLFLSVKKYYKETLSIPDWEYYTMKRLKQEKDGYTDLIKSLGVKPEDTVLSVGSGWGGFGIAVAEIGAKSYLVEPDDERRKISEEMATERGIECQFSNAYAEHLPYPNDIFDFVDCTTVLEHVEDPETALAEMIRVLKQGGTLHLQTTNNWYPSEPHYKIAWIPFIPKWIATIYLKKRGRNPDFIKHLHYFTPAIIDRYFSAYRHIGAIIDHGGYPYRPLNGTKQENIGHTIWNTYVKILGKAGQRNDIIWKKAKKNKT